MMQTTRSSQLGSCSKRTTASPAPGLACRRPICQTRSNQQMCAAAVVDAVSFGEKNSASGFGGMPEVCTQFIGHG